MTAPTRASTKPDDSDEEMEPPESNDLGFVSWLRGAPMTPTLARLLGLYLPGVLLTLNMWRVRAFTIDDAYISFRYARNFANGLGLVYNPGERIEGYTNFLWTVMCAGAIKVGLDPDLTSKVMGAICAYGALYATYTLASKLRPFTAAPCVATWLLASSIVFSGYSIFGLETSLFVMLVLFGILRMMGELGRAKEPEPPAGTLGERLLRLPLSGLIFGLAGLTRPEAPMFIGLAMLVFLGTRIFQRDNLLRGALFVGPIAMHLAFRKSYYGTWLPNTLSAKTGNLEGQMRAGVDYMQNYASHAGPVVWLLVFGVAVALVERKRLAILCVIVSAAVTGYIILVGGDWMPFFRFVAPLEPFAFLLIDLGVRTALRRRDKAAILGFVFFTVVVVVTRARSLDTAQRSILEKEDRFWKKAAGGTARWFVNNGKPGQIAIGDIGYVGYVTDYPILDLLGLVDPVISKLPGGYTHKLGPGFLDRFFDQSPRYALLISSNNDCAHPSVPGSRVIYNDRRFRAGYELAGKVPLDGGFNWCIFESNRFREDEKRP